MLWTWEKRMLHWLAREHYTGAGAIADMGTFLGGSTTCFATGLREQGATGPIHAYDVFKPGPYELREWFAGDPDADPRALFDEHLRGYEDLLEVHHGDVLGFPWEGGPIEILFVDIAKSWLTWDHVVTSFFPALIPGTSVVVLQDYLDERGSAPWHHMVMEKLSGHFAYAADGGDGLGGSVLFRCVAPLDAGLLDACRWDAIPQEEKLALMDGAIARLDTEWKRGCVRASKAKLLGDIDPAPTMVYHRL